MNEDICNPRFESSWEYRNKHAELLKLPVKEVHTLADNARDAIIEEMRNYYIACNVLGKPARFPTTDELD